MSTYRMALPAPVPGWQAQRQCQPQANTPTKTRATASAWFAPARRSSTPGFLPRVIAVGFPRMHRHKVQAIQTGGRMATDNLQLMRDSATRVFQLLAEARAHDQGRRPGAAQTARNEAGRELDKTFSRWMNKFYMRLGLSDEEAQDMTQDAMLRMVALTSTVKSNAFALLCRTRRSVFVDYLKHRNAGKRKAGAGGKDDVQAEVMLTEEDWDLLSDSTGTRDSHDLRNCVEHKLEEFRQASPTRAEVLELHAHGFSAREIAAIIYDKPEDEVTAKEEASVRDRIYNAKKQAQILFAECKD